MLKKAYFVLLVAIFMVGCTTNPITGRSQLIFMPETQIDQMGLQAFTALKEQKPISNIPQSNQFARCVAEILTKETGGQWEIVVFNDSSLNAFALPSNKIGIYTGLINLVDNQDQLAAVIGHEIGHVLSKHSNERASQQMLAKEGLGILSQSSLGQNPAMLGLLGLGAQYGILMPFSREQESEADIIGQELMAKAGFDPEQSVTLWQKMEQASQGKEPAEFLSTHPAHENRIIQLQQHMPDAMNLFQQARAAGQHPQCHK